MIQLVYCILAILILSILTMTSQRGIAGNLEGQTLAEVETQATGVATEVLERIDQSYFDAYTFTQAGVKPYCGRVYGAKKALLATPGAFATCTAGGTPTEKYEQCRYIEGFDGLATPAAPIVFTRGDFTYNVIDISVEYVDETTYATTGTQTYSKKVSVTVENPYLYFGSDASNTFKITFDRVFEYGCATDSNLVPYITATDACPINRVPAEKPCARW